MEETVYPDYEIKRFIEQGIVKSRIPINLNDKGGQVQPSSLDLRCGFEGKRIWHLPYSSIPPKGNLMDYLDSTCIERPLDLSKKRFMHKHAVYVVELEETLSLPPNISAKSSPKSTTGRCDPHARLMIEGGESFDNIPKGYNGKLFLEVVSNSLDLNLPPGNSLVQLRFRNDNQTLSQEELNQLQKDDPFLSREGKPIYDGENFHDSAVFLTLNLDRNDPGYKVRDDAPPLDLSSLPQSLPLSDYFEKVKLTKEGLVTIPGAFFLLKSHEVVKIPQQYCAEMLENITSLGEFRAHYAGYFDPGFNSIAIMEYRNTGKSPFLLRDGQQISALVFSKLTNEPRILYGKDKGSNYLEDNKVRPAKFFYIDL